MKFYHFFYLLPAFIGNLCLASLSYTFSVHPEDAGIISYDSYENCLNVVGNECELVESLVAASNDGYRFSHFLIDDVKIYGEPPLNTIYYFPEGEFNSVNGIYDQGEEFIDALNGEYEEGEVWEDVGNGVYDEGEDFVDALNGIYDIGEAFTDQGTQLEPIVIDYNGVEGNEDLGYHSEFQGAKYYGYSKNILAGEAVTFSINPSSVVGSPEMLILMFDSSGSSFYAVSHPSIINEGLNTINWGPFDYEAQLTYIVAVDPGDSVTLGSFSVSDESGSSIFQATSYISPNGVYDEGEPFVDALNGVYDEGESFTDAGNGIYDEGEAFTDALNGVYDEGEEFTDSFINYYNPTLDHNIEAHFVPDNVIFVDKDALEGGDGMTWHTAFKYLNDAISYANNNSDTFYQIWVAEGTYYTDEGALYSNDDQNSVFNIPSNVESLIGGFSGNEQSKDEANPKQYLTKLSGLIFEEYGATGIGSSYLFTAEGGNPLTVSGFSFNNASDQDGCVLNLSSSNNITFEFCNFSDNQSTENLIQANQNTVFRNCRFERNQTSDGYLIAYGDFESCFFNENVAHTNLIDSAGIIDRSIISNNVSSYSESSVIYRPSRIKNSVVFKNRGGVYVIATRDGTQILHSTFVDNYNFYSQSWAEEIDGAGDFTVGNCIFFRSAFNKSTILSSNAVVGYKSSVNLPVQSAFFGILDYYNSSTSYQYSPRLYNPEIQNPFEGSSVFANTFLKIFKVELPSTLTGLSTYSSLDLGELWEDSRKIFGVSLCNYSHSYIPEFTQEFDIEYPDPFINSSDPLGPDGEPFTEDDGLRLDPNSEWASEVINVPTIDADYELTDILGNNRIIGDLIDLGAYEYMPLEDADGDGISDSNDAFPNNANETLDTDGDGLGDNEDSDDDGDGVDDSVEIATGTDPKQYNSALHSFVQTLGGGAFDADDIAESRLAGQSDVTSDPNTFNLFTQAELTSATETGNTQGQNAVTSDPNSFGLFSSDDISAAQSEFRILGQQDVVSDPLSYGLYSPSYTIGLIDASREAGREDVTSDPSAYGLQATTGSGSNLNSSNVPSSLAGLIEIYRSNPVSDRESAFAGAIYYPSDTELLWYDGDTSNVSEIYSWDKDTQTLSSYDAINGNNYTVVYEFLETSNTSIYMFNYTSDGMEGFGFMYDANGDLNENSVSDKEEFLGLSYIEATNEESYVIGKDASIADELPDSLPELRSSGSNDSSSPTLYSLEEIKDLRPGSTMIEIHNGQATLTMEVEESDDLGVWTNESATSIQIPINAEAGKKFFRFKMAE